MARRARRALAASAVAAAALAALALPGAAGAQSFALPSATVAVRVLPDGGLAVDESITVAFSGRFTFGYRDIPLRPGESIGDVSVSEPGRAYAPGGSTAREPNLAPGTFGVERSSRRASVVWHFSASDETRTFLLHYRLSGVAVAYDDVVDVNLRCGATSGRSRSVG